MREELGYLMKHVSDVNHKELPAEKLHEIFLKEYVNRKDKIVLKDATFERLPQTESLGDNGIRADVQAEAGGRIYELSGEGNGRLDAIMNALRKGPYRIDCDFVTYEEHALESESNARAAAYVALKDKKGSMHWGVGVHNDIIYASVNALLSAINRALAQNER